MKSIFVLLFCIVAVCTARNICTPGAVFVSDCNICTCSKDGKTAACSDMICPEDISNKNICEAGKKFKIDNCTTCLCNEDGTKAQCTYQLCSYRSDIFSIANREYCTPGKIFKPDKCSTCMCNEAGTATQCTVSRCINSQLQVINNNEPICRPLSIFKDYCNTCFCSINGQSFSCTKMLCDRDVWNKNGTVKVVSKEISENDVKDTQVCTPGKTIRDYCNTCVCNDDGSAFSCTRMFCDLEIWNKNGTLKKDIDTERLEKLESRQMCLPNSRFMENCNSCKCSSNGMFKSCTLRNCNESSLKKDESTITVLEDGKSSTEQVCEPGKTYALDNCNTCICNEYGTDVTCTTKVCMTTLKRAPKADQLENLVNGLACVPNSRFMENCNICKCSRNGMLKSCTLRNCNEGHFNIAQSINIVSEEDKTSSELVCEPGKTYMPDDCNTCVCNEYGTDFACTTKVCMTTLKRASKADKLEE